MADLTVNQLTEAGLDETTGFVSCAAGGDAVKVGRGKVFLRVKNTNGATRTVTLTSQKASLVREGFGTLVRGNIAVVVGATTGEKMIGPIPASAFADTNGKCQITYDAVTGLTIKAYELPEV